jgi:hypothetical protein
MRKLGMRGGRVGALQLSTKQRVKCREREGLQFGAHELQGVDTGDDNMTYHKHSKYYSI